MKRKSQADLILSILKKKRNVPRYVFCQPINGHYVASVTARLSELRKAGYIIDCSKQRQSDGVIHTVYTLRGLSSIGILQEKYFKKGRTK